MSLATGARCREMDDVVFAKCEIDVGAVPIGSAHAGPQDQTAARNHLAGVRLGMLLVAEVRMSECTCNQFRKSAMGSATQSPSSKRSMAASADFISPLSNGLQMTGTVRSSSGIIDRSPYPVRKMKGMRRASSTLQTGKQR